MNKINPTPIIVTVIVILGLIVGILIILSQVGEKNTISATGNSQMTVAPDQALVYLLIETRSKSAEDAKNQNALISTNVLTALDKIGISKDQIETENYNLYPEYDWSDNEQNIKGYIASNNIKIKSEDFTDVGKIIDASVDAGSLVSYINFELSNEKTNEYKKQVLAKASEDAKQKAESIAGGLGKKLGDVVSVSSSDFNYMPYPLYRAEASSVSVKEVATDIQPKNLDITASVTVSYAIK
ncbi:SIMPL domain-containing protein [Candidatus Woesearchaeota archaeon]|nr:SIMPL domain-containing protein [Candidatus Woesearchaeota archaeon]